MNRVILSGRLTADPETRSNNETTIASYTLAVDRIGKDKGADFIRCITFGKTAEFAEKYLSKGMKVIVSGRIQTGSYTNKDNQKVYTTDVVVDAHEFCESKSGSNSSPKIERTEDGFMSIPSGLDEELPFN